MRRFECTKDGHAKFWAGAVAGTSLTTRWGKLGTAGQSKTKDFEVFGDGERAAAVETLRKAIWSAGAHIFGKPFWIQEFDGDDDGLLIQINDGLVPELNLGDVGSLYVFEGGDAVFQCH